MLTHVDVGRGKIAVEVEGEGPLILCSPGLGDMRDAFSPLAKFLVGNGYRVARLDLRGHGDSTASFERYVDEATASDMLAVIRELGGGPVVLAGASLSASAAVIAAGQRPDHVLGLILIGPFLRNGASKGARLLLQVALLRPWGPAIWRMYAAKLWPGLGEAARERAAKSTKLLTRPGRWAAFRSTSATDHEVVEPWISRVCAPVFVVMGDADPDWKDPLAEADWVASNFADARTFVVPGAGHAPMLERPDLVGPAILDFMGKVREGRHR